jgi:hypothetical protein
MEETGPIADYEVTNLRLEGGAFTANVSLQFEAGFSIFQLWTFQSTDDGWVVAGSEDVSRPIPPGVPAVDMQLDEYAFIYNEAAINAADGNFAFSVSNVGEEDHEVVLLANDSGEPILDLLAEAGEDEDLPQGVEFVTFGGVFEPGATGTVVLDQPLSSGTYALVCFLPSPDGTPHAFLGMVSEFTIGSGPVDGGGGAAPGGGGTISPPNTGDAGLRSAGGDTATWLMLGIAVTLVLGGAAGFARSRATTRS